MDDIVTAKGHVSGRKKASILLVCKENMRQTAKYSITKCFLVSKMSGVMRAIIIYLRKIKHKLAHSVHHGMFGVGVINYSALTLDKEISLISCVKQYFSSFLYLRKSK